MRLFQSNISRVVIHLQLTCWPSSGLPESPIHLLQFISDIHSYHRQQRSLLRPIIMHCRYVAQSFLEIRYNLVIIYDNTYKNRCILDAASGFTVVLESPWIWILKWILPGLDFIEKLGFLGLLIFFREISWILVGNRAMACGWPIMVRVMIWSTVTFMPLSLACWSYFNAYYEHLMLCNLNINIIECFGGHFGFMLIIWASNE